jgi:hypothetical protein
MTYSVYVQLQRNLPRDYGSKVDEIIDGSLLHRVDPDRGGQMSFVDVASP